MGVDVLSRVYRDIVEVVADAPAPARAEPIMLRIGLPAEVAKIGESARSQVACPTLLRRLPGLRLTVPLANVPFRHDKLAYGLYELPVTW
ncbi:hypothetical protein GCM10022403_085140 [Streptomyces coacervatus]|uniref:Uncharacterized protein n=2 Tax=Streptomyces coacervatus TaxID=647381 RepID=A0ABP7JBX4_9ACTN